MRYSSGSAMVVCGSCSTTWESLTCAIAVDNDAAQSESSMDDLMLFDSCDGAVIC